MSGVDGGQGSFVHDTPEDYGERLIRVPFGLTPQGAVAVADEPRERTTASCAVG